jgi:hypothetical protein
MSHGPKFSFPQRVAIRIRQQRFKNKTSTPFLSGDAFAALADFSVMHEGDFFRLSRQKKSPEIIFCRSDLVPSLTKYLPSTKKNGVFIAGNSDYEFTSTENLPLEHFAQFYLQNSYISDGKKIHTLPIGIENLRVGINGLPRNLKFKNHENLRSPKVLVGPFSPTHSERNELLSLARSERDTFQIIDSSLSPKKYSNLVREYIYIACPRGNGIDTHRFWETMYRGLIPIVKRSAWSQSLEELGLPFLQVNEWSDTSEIIKQHSIDLFFNPKEVENLWIATWKRRILSSK